ncbi:hypothetical protein [Campylobacter concisus]|jgi:hypothetical protein|uniref:hypothetical protein n=1 Tax=Campylobacter concisus TaxID=199 RepID=UPI000CD84EDB|nr:hypothetical protein [Campylobacter concisus]
MATKRTLLKDLKVIRKNEKKEEVKQACIEVLFPQQATLKECKLLIENRYSVKISNKEFSKWRKEYEATNANQPSDACHILVPKEDKKESEELSNGTNNQE